MATTTAKEIKVYEQNNIWVIKNVLTPEECKHYLDYSETIGYGDAPITVGKDQYVLMEDIRNNKRCMFDNVDMVQQLWPKIKDYVPECTSTLKKTMDKDFHVVGLKERIRFYRYTAGQEFKKHYDGCFPRSKTERSFLTLIFYLNDIKEGGATTFYDSSNFSKPSHVIQPCAGDALIFVHNNLHEGSPLPDNSKETKYVLRTDVMYKKQ